LKNKKYAESEEDSVFLDTGNKINVNIYSAIAQRGENPRGKVSPFDIEHTVFMFIVKLYQSILILSWCTAHTVHS
jgi:hypothetical protein